MLDLLQMFVETYAEFFNWHMWRDIFTDPTNWGLIATLIIMEGLLSADNAIVLSILVSHLPEKQRKKALMYGLWGAYFFRFIAIGIGTALTKLWWVKLLGGGYLLWMMIDYFRSKSDEEENDGEASEEERLEKLKKGFLARYFGVFWATVITVELTDIAFSVDSVLAAFGVSESVGILLLGGMLGILMMRGVAQLFTKLVDKFPELKTTAYIIVGFIGIKMLLSTVHEIVKFFGINMHEIHISHTQFFIFLVVLFSITFAVHYSKKRKNNKNAAQT